MATIQYNGRFTSSENDGISSIVKCVVIITIAAEATLIEDSLIRSVEYTMIDGGRIHLEKFYATAAVDLRRAWIEDDVFDGYIREEPATVKGYNSIAEICECAVSNRNRVGIGRWGIVTYRDSRGKNAISCKGKSVQIEHHSSRYRSRYVDGSQSVTG